MHPITFKLKNNVDTLKQKGISEAALRVFAKESLQNHILHAIYSHPKYKELIFYGGTCLRKIYGLNRMSEDLDFESPVKFSLTEIGNYLVVYFKNQEFEKVDYSLQQGEHICRVTIKFPILYELGLSKMASEKLHVKVEVNSFLKGKFSTELTPLMTESLPVIVKHYSIEVMMASKIIACLERVFLKGDTGINIKGRDYYDLLWYMGKGVQPDKRYLASGKKKYTTKSVFNELDKKIEKIKKEDLLIDLLPMFEDEAYIREWCTNFHSFYHRFRKAYH